MIRDWRIGFTAWTLACLTIIAWADPAPIAGKQIRAGSQSPSQPPWQMGAGPTVKPKTDATAAKFISPQIAQLDLFVGPWHVIETHFNAKGEVIASVKGTEEITWILDHRAIQRTYTTRTDSTVFRAVGMLTWNDVDKAYRGVWFNNASTAGPIWVKGKWSKKNRTFVFTLESSGPNGSTIRHKVVERFLDEQRREATTYRIKGNEVIKRMEVRYERSIPCPDRIRTLPVFDDSLRTGDH